MCTSSKRWLWVFSRLPQEQLQRAINNFPSNRLPLWKIRTIYCVLNILWSVLCIKIQLRDQSDEPWNALLLLYRKCMFVLFLCIENCDEPRRWLRAKYECKRNSFSLTLDYYVICFIRTFWLKCTVCNLFTMPPHSIVCISCLSFVIHDKMHSEFCLRSVYGKQKMTIFYYQHV